MPQVVLDAFRRDLISAEVVRQLDCADLPWTRHYGEYQSGGWWTCALLGRSSDSRDAEVCDLHAPRETDALARLPAIQRLLEVLALRFMTARLARMDPGAALWEHRDYQDLEPVARRRLHVAIATNPEAFLVSNGRRHHLPRGLLAIFDPHIPHGACNRGSQARVHLILDAYLDERLEALCSEAKEAPSVVMPRASVEHLRGQAIVLRSQPGAAVVQPAGLAAWEQATLQLYFDFAVAEGDLYQVLEEVCSDAGISERAEFWARRRELVLAESRSS
jgi:hypothetical protein